MGTSNDKKERNDDNDRRVTELLNNMKLKIKISEMIEQRALRDSYSLK